MYPFGDISLIPSELLSFQTSTLWILILGLIFSFGLSFGIGSNDVANQFGTSVGAKVITLKNACIIATIFELLGAVTIGYKVSDTIRKGIIDVAVYDGSPEVYMMGNLAALGGSATWLLLATFLKLPISGTHSIIGAVLGFSLVARGFEGINWFTLAKIVLSWFVSPVLSGIVSSALFMLIRKFILSKPDPIEPGLNSLPFFYGATIFINLISILIDGPDMLKISLGPNYGEWTSQMMGLLTAFLIGILTSIVVFFIIVPKMRRVVESELKVQETRKQKSIEIELELSQDIIAKKWNNNNLQVFVPMDGVTPNASGVPLIKIQPNMQTKPSMKHKIEDLTIKETPGVGKLFSFLQILTAAFGSFAHGGNDVSNAIGPLIALWLVYANGDVQQKSATPIGLLLYGGIGIILGLWIWGRRVIKTMGEDLTEITPSSGFTIEMGSAITVLCASKIGLPISTTHCKVGSVVSVGYVRSRNSVDWSLFRNIALAWVITVPLSGVLSALLMWILQISSKY